MMKHLKLCHAALLIIFSIGLQTPANGKTFLPLTDDNTQNVTDDTSKAKKKKNKASKERETVLKDYYLFGIAQNYHDSVTYLTNITPIKNVVCDKATGFIDGLNLYTKQLEIFLLQKGHAGYICATFYAKNMKSAEKKYLSLRKKINKRSYTHIEPLGEFMYQFVSPENIYRNVPTEDNDHNDQSETSN